MITEISTGLGVVLAPVIFATGIAVIVALIALAFFLIVAFYVFAVMLGLSMVGMVVAVKD